MNCGDEGCRSPIFTDVTDQFLHRKAHATKLFAGVTGLEPATIDLTGRRSKTNYSYTPNFNELAGGNRLELISNG